MTRPIGFDRDNEPEEVPEVNYNSRITRKARTSKRKNKTRKGSWITPLLAVAGIVAVLYGIPFIKQKANSLESFPEPDSPFEKNYDRIDPLPLPFDYDFSESLGSIYFGLLEESVLHPDGI